MNYDRDWVQKVKQALEDTGIAIDESLGMGTMPFKRDSMLLIKDLRSLGLEGKINTGAYSPCGGIRSTVYWMSLDLEYDEAKRKVERWVSANPDS